VAVRERGAAAAAAACCAVLLAATPAAAGSPDACLRPAHPPVEQTLERLGRPELHVALDRRVASRSVRVRLPRRSAQGRDGRWFVVRLHIGIIVSAGSGDGFADVSALLNGRSAMLVEFDTRHREGRPPSLHWSTAGLIDGRRHVAGTAGRLEDIEYSNYAQLRSLHGGRNRLTFRVEQYGKLRIQRLTIAADSGVLSTTLPPPRLKLEVADHVAPADLTPGHVIRLPFRLVNVGGCPARDVEIGVIRPRDAVQVVGRPTRRIGVLRREVAGTFAIRAVRSGTQRVLIGANSNANSPGVVVELPIRAHANRRGPLRALALASIVAAVLSTVLWLRSRPHRPA
jgi:hypothetical protein